MSEKPKSLSEIDSFWELEELMPTKRRNAPRREVNTDTVELELPALDSESLSDSRFGGSRIPPNPNSGATVGADTSESAHRSARDEARRLRELPMRVKAQQNEPHPLEPYLTYLPDSRLLKRVSVAKWQTRYSFYEKFRTDAHRLWDRTATPCDPISFFSYIPQYNQFSYAQLKWYIFWREQVRAKTYPNTDYSYILLYIYEILNCPELVAPEQGVELLCDIWLAYRSRYPRIDNYLGEWLCDYCLIYQLPCPAKRLESISQAIVSAVSFKEFYMDPSRQTDGAASVLSYSSNYDWRTSRYVTRENLPIFAEHIGAAFELAYREILSDSDNGESAKLATIVRDAYSGALCVWDMKRSLTVEYVTYTRSPKFRFIVTDIIKYCENRVRMALGIKARLKVEELTDEMKACLDRYFDAKLPIKRSEKAKKSLEPTVNEYDKLYEPTSTSLSLENALAIEKSSWSTTEILTASLTDEPGENTASSAPIPEPSREDSRTPTLKVESKTEKIEPIPVAGIIPGSGTTDGGDEFELFVSSLDTASLDAMKRLAQGDESGVEKSAKAAGMLADALADKINELAFDIIGDSMIEPSDGGFTIISDYQGELEKWLM